VHRHAISRRCAPIICRTWFAPGTKDTDEFKSDPSRFCSTRTVKDGAVFTTEAFGGTVFVGGPAALQIPSSAPVVAGALGAPFTAAAAAAAGADDLFAKHCDSFNAECYNVLFNWIPMFKEAGFSTFRFEDFIDERVRKMLPSARELFLRAAAPALFGHPWEEVPKRLGFESPKELTQLYQRHATSRRDSGALGLPLPLELPAFLPLGRGGGSTELQEALGGEAALDELCASVEQAAALYCNLLVTADAETDASAELAAEQAGVLKNLDPKAPITSEILSLMPKLDAFVLETLRLQPPARPARCTLTEATRLGDVALAAGSVVAAELLSLRSCRCTWTQLALTPHGLLPASPYRDYRLAGPWAPTSLLARG